MQPKIQTNFMQIAAFAVLGILLTVCIVFAWMTRDSMSSLPQVGQPGRSAQSALVQPWQTALDLASLAVTAEEGRFANTAERLADHEVHQAFQAALGQAQVDVQKRSRDPEARKLAQAAQQRQQIVDQDQAAVKALTQAQTPADASNNSLDLANAQLDLDSDELKDAQQKLARKLEDQRAELEQELANHEAAVKKYDADKAAKSLSAVATSRNYGTVARRLTAWLDQRSRYQALLQAAERSEASATQLAVKPMNKPARTATPANGAQAVPPANSDADSQLRMSAMKSASLNKRMMLLATDRIETEKQLAANYRKWAAQVTTQHRLVFHLLMQSLAYLIAVLVCALAIDTFIRYFFDHNSAATAKLGRRQYSLRVILRLTITVVAFVAVFLLVFGPPSQLSTVIGLTTAGLTVVLQDFIISFCGWFVLMGKHGIRIGDWVEIDSIGGEVVDIGLFRTALLETGNWTDSGHPTGRRITFANSFAIKGQYFNFTTNGQWMWDELSVTVPASEAYGTVELIHKVVLEETAADSQMAEDEFRSNVRSTGLGQINAQATVNMRPSVGGVDILVRYVTRASKRSEMRTRLYHQVLELLHKPVAT